MCQPKLSPFCPLKDVSVFAGNLWCMEETTIWKLPNYSKGVIWGHRFQSSWWTQAPQLNSGKTNHSTRKHLVHNTVCDNTVTVDLQTDAVSNYKPLAQDWDCYLAYGYTPLKFVGCWFQPACKASATGVPQHMTFMTALYFIVIFERSFGLKLFELFSAHEEPRLQSKPREKWRAGCKVSWNMCVQDKNAAFFVFVVVCRIPVCSSFFFFFF